MWAPPPARHGPAECRSGPAGPSRLSKLRSSAAASSARRSAMPGAVMRRALARWNAMMVIAGGCSGEQRHLGEIEGAVEDAVTELAANLLLEEVICRGGLAQGSDETLGIQPVLEQLVGA